MENGRQLVLGDDLVEPVSHAVVREKSLHGRMKLEALDDALVDQARASRTPILPLCGSMVANASMMSLFSRRGVGDLLVRDAPAPISNSLDREHHEADLALAVIGDGLRNRRALAGLEIFRSRVLVLLPNVVYRLAAGHFGVRVHIDRDQIVHVHDRSPTMDMRDASQLPSVRPSFAKRASSGAGCQCIGPNRSRYFRMPSWTVLRPMESA